MSMSHSSSLDHLWTKVFAGSALTTGFAASFKKTGTGVVLKAFASGSAIFFDSSVAPSRFCSLHGSANSGFQIGSYLAPFWMNASASISIASARVWGLAKYVFWMSYSASRIFMMVFSSVGSFFMISSALFAKLFGSLMAALLQSIISSYGMVKPPAKITGMAPAPRVSEKRRLHRSSPFGSKTYVEFIFMLNFLSPVCWLTFHIRSIIVSTEMFLLRLYLAFKLKAS